MDTDDLFVYKKQSPQKHKAIPTHLSNVAIGVQRRLQTNLKHRKSCRFTQFDHGRDLEEQPDTVNDAHKTNEHRNQLLKKWKEEKAMKKKNALNQKKKPFVVGIVHAPMKYVPLPPLKPLPSISGCVTRSQRNNVPVKKEEPKSFAPKNATFKPPQMINVNKLPSLSISNSKKVKITNFTFEPVLPNGKHIAKPVLPSVPFNGSAENTRTTRMMNRALKTQSSTAPNEVSKPKSPRKTRASPIKRRPSPKKIQKQTKTIESSGESSTDLQESIKSRGRKPASNNPVLQVTSRSRKPVKISSDLQESVRSQLRSTVNSDSDSQEPVKSRLRKPATNNSALKETGKRELRKYINNLELQEPVNSGSRKPNNISDLQGPAKTRSRKPINNTVEPMETVNILSSMDSQESVILPTKKKTTRKSSNATPKRHAVPKKTVSISSEDSQESVTLPTKAKTPRKSTHVTPKRQTIPKSESSSEEKLRSPKDQMLKTPQSDTNLHSSIDGEPMTPQREIKTSPNVTVSRGKDNARREMKQKLKEGLFEEDASDINEVEHLRNQLDSEIKRMTLMCEEWDAVLQQNELPEFVQELILGATGQARLLMSQKFRQFSVLMDRCEARDVTHGLVTPADLDGFWDMLFIQIENIDMRFKKLREVRERGWREDVAVQQKKQTAGRVTKKKSAPSSKLKDMIAAARKAQKLEAAPSPAQKPAVDASSKSFEAGFFTVRTPVQTPGRSPRAAGTPLRDNLLKSVLSSEAKKASASRNSASYAMLRASLIGKGMEMDGVAPLEQTPKLPSIDLNATPPRSILKSEKKRSQASSTRKSIKTVLFINFDNENDTSLNDSAKENGDSGLSSNPSSFEDKKDKTNISKTTKITRQNAVESSPEMIAQESPVSIMTRSRRSMQTPKDQKVLQEIENIDWQCEVSEKTNLRRSSRRELKDLIAFTTPPRVARRRRNKKSEA